MKHTALLVKFDETEFDAIKINVPTHINEQVDVLHSKLDLNYAVSNRDMSAPIAFLALIMVMLFKSW